MVTTEYGVQGKEILGEMQRIKPSPLPNYHLGMLGMRCMLCTEYALYAL